MIASKPKWLEEPLAAHFSSFLSGSITAASEQYSSPVEERHVDTIVD
jgi:hypothetical protein